MSESAVTTAPRLGYRFCSADCGAEVHYRWPTCKACGAVQDHSAKPEAAKAPAPAAAKPAAAPAPTAPVRAIESTALNVVITPPPVAPVPYVMLADFRGQVGDVLCILRRGAIVTDHNLIGQLVDLGAPIAPETLADGLVCCPHCKTMFQPTPRPMEPKRRAG